MRRPILLGLAALLAALAGCAEDGATLPADYNTLKFRRITVTPNQKEEPPIDLVRPLNGMDGAPVAVVPGDAALLTRYWGRTAGSTQEDGAHVTMVRVGTGTTCGVSLEGIFPDAAANPDQPTSYAFSVLDQHVEAVQATNTAVTLWQAAFNPGAGGACEADADGTQRGRPLETAAEAALWAKVAFNTLRHLNDGDAWDPAGKRYGVRYVEFLDDPLDRMGYTAGDVDALWPVYGSFADLVKGRWPDDAGTGEPQVRLGGISFTLTSVDELTRHQADPSQVRHPLLRFVDWCADEGAPLDLLTFRTRTVQPYEAFEIAQELRRYLDEHPDDAGDRFQRTQLVATGISFAAGNPELIARGLLDDPRLESTYLGAFQSAARIFMQGAPVDWATAGRGPRVLADLAPHLGQDPVSLSGITVDSPYFEGDATALPAFMAMFPFRQVAGHRRVKVASDDREGLAVLASHPTSSDRVLHLIVANANVLSGEGGLNANITYEIRVDNFVPPSVPQVSFKFASLDRNAVGVDSFFFSETGVLETLRGTGSVSFTHEMAVPSVHYIQLEKPSL